MLSLQFVDKIVYHSVMLYATVGKCHICSRGCVPALFVSWLL